MNIKNIVDDLRSAIEPTGFGLYFGLMSQYNAKRTPADKEVILEPFTFRIARENLTFYDTEFKMWVGVKRSINAKYLTDVGKNDEFIDELLNHTEAIISAIGESSTVLIKQKQQNINLTYYEADGGGSVNQQAFITFSIPVRVWI
jgi:hypothetical protein